MGILMFLPLTFKTIKGAINADVGLYDHSAGSELAASTSDGYEAPVFPFLPVILTSHRLVKTSISLFSHNAGNTGGQFKVSATSVNGPVTVNFPTAPVDSLLSLDATTTKGAVTVTLHPTYEGGFQVSTTLGKAVLNYNPDITDPAGEGRVRKVEKRPTVQKIDGSVAWVKPSANLKGQLKAGSVKVSTVVLGATLNLNP
jgi:hypothetical protein